MMPSDFDLLIYCIKFSFPPWKIQSPRKILTRKVRVREFTFGNSTTTKLKLIYFVVAELISTTTGVDELAKSGCFC